MEKRTLNIIIITVAIFFMLAIVGVGIYYVVSFDLGFVKPIVNKTENQNNQNLDNRPIRKIPTAKEIEAQNNANFPDAIIGIIKFLEGDKATLKTGNIEYVFYPDQPIEVYKSFGVANGDRVEVRAKILEGNKIKWLTIKKVSE